MRGGSRIGRRLVAQSRGMSVVGLTIKEVVTHAVLLGVPASIVSSFWKKDVSRSRLDSRQASLLYLLPFSVLGLGHSLPCQGAHPLSRWWW